VLAGWLAGWHQGERPRKVKAKEDDRNTRANTDWLDGLSHQKKA